MSDVTDRSVLIVGGRRRGRPPVLEPFERVSTRVPIKYHDRLIRLANERAMSVSALVRSLLLSSLQRP